jgi:DNA-directed RNA polymerase subunit E'/Rpb7
MSRITIEKKICLEPNMLDENITNHLLDKIKLDYLKKCDQEHGYITKIYDKIHILDNIISSSSIGVFFRVRFTVKAHKPQVNSEYDGKVCMVFQNGIFVEVFEKMKVLIPNNKMGKYKYNKNIYKDGNKTISVGDEVKIKIDMIKYEKQNFNCIGSLKISDE